MIKNVIILAELSLFLNVLITESKNPNYIFLGIIIPIVFSLFSLNKYAIKIALDKQLIFTQC
ncbi:hypothetical protein [uncultured Lutibacter sp.]|uniref:hypothetical protein n=1 Tax=uncultured Lutibacter sp. TaxID=437739 RepID=UPI0026127267|nr:hypothetical protein [uncultured Lutibacter sp.]